MNHLCNSHGHIFLHLVASVPESNNSFDTWQSRFTKIHICKSNKIRRYSNYVYRCVRTHTYSSNCRHCISKVVCSIHREHTYWWKIYTSNVLENLCIYEKSCFSSRDLILSVTPQQPVVLSRWSVIMNRPDIINRHQTQWTNPQQNTSLRNGRFRGRGTSVDNTGLTATPKGNLSSRNLDVALAEASYRLSQWEIWIYCSYRNMRLCVCLTSSVFSYRKHMFLQILFFPKFCSWTETVFLSLLHSHVRCQRKEENTLL